MRRRRVAAIALRLGRPELLRTRRVTGGALARMRAKPDGGGMPGRLGKRQEDPSLRPIERPAGKPHEDVYAAALLTPFGIRPIVDAADVAEMERCRRSAMPAMLYGISTRHLPAGQSVGDPWIADWGIATPDGAGLFELRNVEEA